MKIASTLLILILSKSLLCQVSLDHTNVPEAGLEVNYYQKSNPGLDMSESGINQTWDMSAIAIPDSIWLNLIYVEPLSLDSGIYYPDANLAMTINNSGVQYYSSTASSFSLVGVDAGPNYYTYDEPYELMPLPLSFGDSNEFEWSYERFQHANDEIEYFEGNTTMEVDGYGDLILPYGVVENVLRVKYEQDVFQVTSQGELLFAEHIIEYQWFEENLQTFVAQLRTYESANNFQSLLFVTQETLTSEVKELNSDRLDFQIFPNPASERLQIDCRNFRGKGKIMNTSGQLVRSFSVTEGENLLNVNDLSQGLYMVQLIDTDGQQATRRLVIE